MDLNNVISNRIREKKMNLMSKAQSHCRRAMVKADGLGILGLALASDIQAFVLNDPGFVDVGISSLTNSSVCFRSSTSWVQMDLTALTQSRWATTPISSNFRRRIVFKVWWKNTKTKFWTCGLTVSRSILCTELCRRSLGPRECRTRAPCRLLHINSFDQLTRLAYGGTLVSCSFNLSPPSTGSDSKFREQLSPLRNPPW